MLQTFTWVTCGISPPVPVSRASKHYVQRIPASTVGHVFQLPTRFSPHLFRLVHICSLHSCLQVAHRALNDAPHFGLGGLVGGPTQEAIVVIAMIAGPRESATRTSATKGVEGANQRALRAANERSEGIPPAVLSGERASARKLYLRS